MRRSLLGRYRVPPSAWFSGDPRWWILAELRLPLSRRDLVARLESLAARDPNRYRLLVAALALLGACSNAQAPESPGIELGAMAGVNALTDVTLDFDTATDPTLVKRFGIQIHSGT